MGEKEAQFCFPPLVNQRGPMKSLASAVSLWNRRMLLLLLLLSKSPQLPRVHFWKCPPPLVVLRNAREPMANSFLSRIHKKEEGMHAHTHTHQPDKHTHSCDLKMAAATQEKTTHQIKAIFHTLEMSSFFSFSFLFFSSRKWKRRPAATSFNCVHFPQGRIYLTETINAFRRLPAVLPAGVFVSPKRARRFSFPFYAPLLEKKRKRKREWEDC